MIATRLTRALGIDHPILSAPMAGVAGGALAAAVSHGGGLGLIGGGYGDPDWLATQLEAAGNAPVGIGFITWKLAERPQVLEVALARTPRAVFLSFGDPMPFASAIAAAGAELICQVQTLDHARRALAAGAGIIVAQGGEAGGHGARRATLTLVPELADLLAREAPETLLVAAGGIADGRGLAAALMLGADGVLCGTRFWAAAEALRPPGHLEQALAATGDATIQTSAVDAARGLDWPAPYRIRVLANEFTDRWHDRVDVLREDAAARADWQAALAEGRTDTASAIVGEGIGLVHDAPPARAILDQMVAQARTLLDGGWQR
ncbi:NAD(P)H-dependent flavin oxidoreductase [Pseudooceanicola aestuarii]|uniref:NAD(P)H-dependent flavin oxidoreductase n=1 Tax=Pseudooceanicola aestuarii TaxID=2697319 RepID=UPI0013D36871|nr:nitronate monooxygenase [Pseudooceanicola aestuarii]